MISLCVALLSCGVFERMPSDKGLIDKFLRNRSDFVNLIEMCAQDPHVVVITSSYTRLDTDASWPRSNIGFSEQRWNEYRRLFRKLGIEAGISRHPDYPDAIFVNVYGAGGAVGGGSFKGYVYSQSRLHPTADTLDKMPSKQYENDGHAIVVKYLEKDWYLYREEF